MHTQKPKKLISNARLYSRFYGMYHLLNSEQNSSHRTDSGAFVGVGTCPHQVLAATLTLFQPEGQIMPTIYVLPWQYNKLYPP